VDGAPAGRSRAAIHLLPRTRLGVWAVRLLIAFAALFLTLCVLVAAGQRGVWLVSLVIPLFLSGLLAGATGAVAVVRRGERSVLVFLPLVVGILIAIFLLGELVGHD
jgi:hypothetical protein